MKGKQRILTALDIQQPDRVPLYIHGINEAPIIGIGRHITDGLPEIKQFHEMNDSEKIKLLDTLFLIHEEFGIDGFTSFEIVRNDNRILIQQYRLESAVRADERADLLAEEGKNEVEYPREEEHGGKSRQMF